MAYLPTWRDDDPEFILKAIPDFQRLNDALVSANVLLVIKLHPNNNVPLPESSNIRTLSSGVDMYPLLQQVDGVITDFSSIMFDYAILEKPIYFYATDIESYTANRGFYFEYSEVTEGKTLTSFDTLLRFFKNPDAHAIDAKAMKAKFWDTESRNASEDLYQILKSMAATEEV